MKERELGLEEIYQRLKIAKDEIGLNYFRRNPTKAVNSDKFPALFMEEGVDSIVDRNSRNQHGYPARRVCEVILEINTTTDQDIRDIFGKVRKALFTQRGTPEGDPPIYSPKISDLTFFREIRTEGPSGVDIPDVLIMSLVVELVYTDNPF